MTDEAKEERILKASDEIRLRRSILSDLDRLAERQERFHKAGGDLLGGAVGVKEFRRNRDRAGQELLLGATVLDIRRIAAYLHEPSLNMESATVERSSSAIVDVARERDRQVCEEGWTTEHDDDHDGGSMALAAMCYADPENGTDDGRHPPPASRLWPWDMKWWKPGSRRRNLVKAAALLVAEVERLDRATAPKGVKP